MTDASSDLLKYIDASPTPYHAVATAVLRLMESGFREWKADETWTLAPGDQGFLEIGDSALIAFRVGRDTLQRGFRIVGAHTDSPNLRIKPHPDLSGAGLRRLGLEPYGGLQLATWVDRDLGVAGQAVCYGESGVETRLFRIHRPVCRVATLAIHLNREVNEKGLILNKQTEMPALFGGAVKDDGSFRRFLAAELGIDRDALIGWDAQLYDLTPSTLGGERGEFIFAPRLDNLASCHAGLLGLMAATPAEATSVLVCFDHEEVGSQSTCGADSPILANALRRILAALGHTAPQDADRAFARSTLISADMAHALHPNFADKHDGNHAPLLNGGPVIKANVNQRYATTAQSAAHFERLCRGRDLPVQRFNVRSDMACGSTIGPISAGITGIQTVDVGNPMLSMHSAREMAGTDDHPRMVAALTAHFEGV